MKRLVFFLLFICLNIVYAKTIIIGTYSTENNARVQFKKVLETMQGNPKMSALQEKEGFDYGVRKLANYYIVSIEPFAHDTELFEALTLVRKNFPDAYVHVPTAPKTLQTPKSEAPLAEVPQEQTDEEFAEEEIAADTEVPDTIESEEPVVLSEEDAALHDIVATTINENDDASDVPVSVADEVQVDETPVIVHPKKESSPYLQMLVKLPQEYLMIGGGIVVLVLLLLIISKRRGVKKEQRGLPDLEIEHPENLEETLASDSVIEDTFEVKPVDDTVVVEDNVNDEFELSSEDERNIDDALEAFEEDSDSLDDLGVLDDDTAKVAEETPQEHSRKKRNPENGHGEIHKDDFKDFQGLRVLVAEDNIINQKVLKGMLNESGIELVMAENGQEALNILENDASFALVLMDAHMPIMDGYDATRAIRADSRFDDIAVIALTGDVASDDIRKLYESGMEGHLEKPIHMGALYDVFYTYSDDEEAEETQVQNDDIEMDIEEEIPSEVSVGMMALHATDGLNAAGGDKELYNEILDEFVSMYHSSDKIISKFIDENRASDAAAMLLDIKGLAGSIGGQELEAVSEELRTALVHEDMFTAQDLQHRFHRALNTILEDIKEYRAQ